ncbi:DNA excision repair protein ERCC-6-like 2 [Electrophorus electricus]|uniref:DNA excision repair protein ERCC-6-like 2 n=1 Tax=Electrophorus electricus TaxID=8005 RepID=UPI0015D0A2F9|nr:DNA excision repair protein ERCC-6-like 2 [Electrophorus electricus]
MEEDDTGLRSVSLAAGMINAPSEDEKPLFHTNQSPGPSEPFLLSGNGDQVPYTINRYLRDYQREGVKFIYNSYVKSRGCILGDDMGLGKTVQVISFLAAVLQKTGTWKDVEKNRPEFLQSQRSWKPSKMKRVFLIVAPLSVLYNWKDELDTWGHFKTVIVHGVKKEEELARVNRGRCEIALTTYETLRLCLDQFNSIDWAAVIVDEAHKLKNHKSQITQAMKDLRCKVRVGLTGTILQNNLEELWCVMDWAIPGCLDSLASFKNKFSDPIEQGQKHSVTKRALAEGRRAVQTLAKRLSRWFLRRTKALISEQLPKKDDRVVYCSLTDFQQAVYRAVLDTDDVTLLLCGSQRCQCGSGRPRKKCCQKCNSDGVPVKHMYFSYLAILRKVANHVALLQSKEGTSKTQEKYVNSICEKVFTKFPDFTERCKQAAFEAISDPKYSGKMKVLQRLLSHFIKRKDKVLLFSFSTKLLDVLESFCMAEGLNYRRLDGTTKSKERLHIVKEFNSSGDINLCLVSTMAGGLGLNFVGANVVVLFDPTWNPANDLQAVDRVYRIGQCKDVTVFRLISLGTVEEVIYLRQVYKQQLQSSVIGRENARRYFEAVQGADGQAGELFGMRNLFRLQTDGTCLTHRVLAREGQLEVGIMTASTQAVEERSTGPGPGSGGVSGQHGGPVPVCSAGLADGEILEFSSNSEDEDPCGSQANMTKTSAGAEPVPGVTLSNSTGLSALLLRHVVRMAQGCSDSSEESQDDSDTEESQDDSDTEEPRATEGEADGRLSSDSEEEGEGDEAESPCRPPAKQNPEPGVTAGRVGDEPVQRHPAEGQQSAREGSGSERRLDTRGRVAGRSRRLVDDIKSFTSSEDEALVRKVKGHISASREVKSGLGCPVSTRNTPVKSVMFAGLRSPTAQPSPASEPNAGTIDTLLGGLQEVRYTHSNQKVVGSSRMENRLSRAALRDVFKLNKHSQLPANHLSDLSEGPSPAEHYITQQTQRDSARGGEEGQTPAHPEGPRLRHQVVHSIRASHRTPSVTLSVGQTPAAVRKNQLEEMARFFGARCVRAFAEELVESSSAQRLSKLAQFYSHRSPELTDIIEQTFSEPKMEPKARVSPPPSACNAAKQGPTSKRSLLTSVQRSHEKVLEEAGVASKKKRMTNARHTKDLSNRCMGPPELRTETISPPESGQSLSELPQEPYSGVQPQSQANPSPMTPLGRVNPSPLRRTRKDQVSPAEFSRTDLAEPGPARANKTFITDLIGDTSILDDLLKPKRSGERLKLATAPMAAPTERVKNKGKDFWDILNEGNIESIDKLTDLSQVEKVCRSAAVSGRSKRENELESSQLWKKNEKFLWKR